MEREHRFSGPTGLYATPEGELYVADTNNGRVVHFSAQGEPLRIIGAPESEVEGILPEGFVYRPLKLGVDNHGRLYVIARDLPEGLITFSEDGQFRGFIGAPRYTKLERLHLEPVGHKGTAGSYEDVYTH